jgi:hypothetical protein
LVPPLIESQRQAQNGGRGEAELALAVRVGKAPHEKKGEHEQEGTAGDARGRLPLTRVPQGQSRV